MKKIYGYALAAAMLSLASCSSDAPEINNPEVIDGPVVGYVKMNLPAGTRAEDAQKVIFCKGTSTVTAKLADGYTDVYALSDIPDKVYVFRASTEGAISGLTYNTGSTTTDKTVKSPAVKADGSYGAAIPASVIFNDINQASSAQAVTVYLDQVVAKTTVDASDAAEKADMSGNTFADYKITFVPTHAFVNGVATETRIIKQLPSLSNDKMSIWGVEFAKSEIDYADANGNGSSWTSSYENWNGGKVDHYVLADQGSLKQENTLIFERAAQEEKSATKDYTHVIVAGYYQLTKKGTDTPLDVQTFYVYSSNLEGEGIVYFSEADVVKAMGGTASQTLSKAKKTEGGMSTHMTLTVNGVEKSCTKYDGGYVYYAAPIRHFEKEVDGENVVINGVVRNHEYKITVGAIKGWGTAIPDKTEKIIPEDPQDPTSSYIKLNIVVNEFVSVDDQEVEWK